MGSEPSPHGRRLGGSSASDAQLPGGGHGHHRLHRGENNRAMREYAALIGARYLIEDGCRCSCGHMDSRLVVKCKKRICQVCFTKGVRF